MTRPENKDPATWPKCSFFAIYDGHGGSMCADFLKDHLHQIIITQTCFPSDPRKALAEGCRIAEERFLRMADMGSRFDKSGSCAIIVLTVETECYVANVGDSRAIMSAESGMRVFELSQDHRPNEEAEFYRI
jgi:protein phosphatase 2C family protein 2/3